MNRDLSLLNMVALCFFSAAIENNIAPAVYLCCRGSILSILVLIVFLLNFKKKERIQKIFY